MAASTAHNKTSPQTYARLAGFLYLLMLPLGILGILYVPNALYVSGDAAATASNIMDNALLFRVSIVAALLVQVNQTFLVLALYKVLQPAGKNMAALMLVLILVAVPIAMLNEVNRFAVLILLSGADYLATISSEQLQTFSLVFLDIHGHGIVIAQIFWGLWLFPMGYLVYKSGYIPRILGILLMIGCLGYLVDSFLIMLVPEVGFTLSQYTFIGELLLPLWLVTKGVNVEQWKERAQVSA